MKLSEFLSAEYIKIDTKGHTKFQIIEELMGCIKNSDKVVDEEVALKDVFEREKYLSTGLENGLAVPHGKTEGVTGLVMALGINRAGIDFDSLDGNKTQIIFLLVSPKDTSGPHIQALAKITRKMKNDNLRKRLLDAKSESEIMDVFTELDEEN